MAFRPRVPVSPCKLLILFDGHASVKIEVLPTIIVASLKDLVLSALSLPLSSSPEYLLGLSESKLLQVEFVRLQTSNPLITEAINAQQEVVLKLFRVHPKSSKTETAATLIPKSSTQTASAKKLPSQSSSKSNTLPSRPRLASKIGRLASFFSTSSSSSSTSSSPSNSPSKSSVAPNKLHEHQKNQITSVTPLGTVYVDDLPEIEHVISPAPYSASPPPGSNSNNMKSETQAEIEVVEESPLESEILPHLSALTASSDPIAEPESNNQLTTKKVDLSRQSLTLDGDLKIAVENISPPVPSSRFSFIEQHTNQNQPKRHSNVPVLLYTDTEADKARYEAMIRFFTPQRSDESLVKAEPAPESPKSQVDTTQDKSTLSNLMDGYISIDSPLLLQSTSSLSIETKSKFVTTKILAPLKIQTQTSKSDSCLRFVKTAEKMATHIKNTGQRILDWVASPFAVGRFLRPERKFSVVLLPAGPQLIKSDMEQQRYHCECDYLDTPSSIMQKILLLPKQACNDYILRICGRSEYLLDNDRPLVEYSKLRIMIRERRRLELLCDLRVGMRMKSGLSNHFAALCAENCPSTLNDPFYGIELAEQESCDLSMIDEQVMVKVHALEQFNFDVLKSHLDFYSDSSFLTLKSQFLKNGSLQGTDMSFSIEVNLSHNSRDICKPVRTSVKQSPMWVEQIRISGLNWSQLPQESRFEFKLLFKKSKTSKSIVIARAFVNIFNSYGLLGSGKIAVPLLPYDATSKKPFVASTSPITSTFRDTHYPILHFEIFEVKSGLLVLHDRSPYKNLIKRSNRLNASPIEFLIPDKPDGEELSRLLRIHPLYQLNDEEKAVIWKYRYYLHFSHPHSLPLLSQCVNWVNPKQVEELHRLVYQWPLFDPLIALELLDFNISDVVLRNFAVDCLRKASDEEIVDYMIQLVQALLFEPFHDSALSRFLLERALRNRTLVGSSLYWNLVSVDADINDQERIQLFVECYLLTCGNKHARRLASQGRILSSFRQLSARASKMDPKAKMALLEAELNPELISSLPMEQHQTTFNETDWQNLPEFSQPVSVAFNFLNLPLDPSICTRRIIKSKCKFMVSSAAPMWLVFDNADPLGSPTPAIFKTGDDLRQDILVLQLLNLMDSIWQRDGLELHVSAYGCVATAAGEGFIEVVPNATTTGKIQKDFGASGAFRKTPLATWIQQQHSEDTLLHEEAIDNFVSSCAAYCIASYVLGLGDRHADNIMITRMGNLFHIDFAHILGNIMMFGAYKRERAPFVLTPEFVFVMGDTKSPKYARFVDLCLKGYNSLRRHTYLFIRLFKMMLNAGLPQFNDLKELSYLYKSLSLGLSEKGAADKFFKLIDESRKTTTTLVNNFFHNLATGAPLTAPSKELPKLSRGTSSVLTPPKSPKKTTASTGSVKQNIVK